MIKINHTENKISVKGHAGYAPQGFDGEFGVKTEAAG